MDEQKVAPSLWSLGPSSDPPRSASRSLVSRSPVFVHRSCSRTSRRLTEWDDRYIMVQYRSARVVNGTPPRVVPERNLATGTFRSLRRYRHFTRTVPRRCGGARERFFHDRSSMCSFMPLRADLGISSFGVLTSVRSYDQKRDALKKLWFLHVSSTSIIYNWVGPDHWVTSFNDHVVLRCSRCFF